MVSGLFQMDSSIYKLSIALIIALFILVRSALIMIEKKRFSTFVPFFTMGLGLCLTAGFVFYGFFGIAVDIFYTFNFISIIGIFFIIWRATR